MTGWHSPALGVALVLLARHGPLRIMNIPHRSYRTTGDRQAVVRRMLSADMAAIMSVTLVFLALLPLWTVLESGPTDNAVEPTSFWVPTAISVVGVVSWAACLTRCRYRPTSGE